MAKQAGDNHPAADATRPPSRTGCSRPEVRGATSEKVRPRAATLTCRQIFRSLRGCLDVAQVWCRGFGVWARLWSSPPLSPGAPLLPTPERRGSLAKTATGSGPAIAGSRSSSSGRRLMIRFVRRRSRAMPRMMRLARSNLQRTFMRPAIACRPCIPAAFATTALCYSTSGTPLSWNVP